MEVHLQFTNGWVQDLQIYRVNHFNTVVLTKVLHSQRLHEIPLRPWVIISTSGQVESAPAWLASQSHAHMLALSC
ncbi:hypothetical protein CHARACLAT_006567 [Characodon lateralis]|uniref:Uncharacterized protein n=1 Tax=Characodon lateralis TaxID=208331 RepID=A0ABU7DYA9_9TELE|nr:hypothetical protein [Characodon lateralis]